MEYCVNNLALRDRYNQQQQFVTITKQEYQQLNRRKNQTMASQTRRIPSPFEPLQLDYELPKSAFTFTQPKWSQIQESINILQKSAPDILNPNFLEELYSKIYAKLPSANHNEQFFVSKGSDKTMGRGSMTMNFEKKRASLQILNRNKRFTKSQPQINQAEYSECGLEQGEQQKTISDKLFRSQKASEHVVKEQIAVNDAVKMGKTVIKIFCEQGYDPQAFQQALIHQGYASQISSFHCQDVIKSILISAYAKLQAFLKIQCKLEISSLSLEVGDNVVVNSLMHFKQNYSPDCSQTLQNIIRGQCGLTYQPVTQPKAVKLYQQIEKNVLQHASETRLQEVKAEPQITVLSTCRKIQDLQPNDNNQTQLETKKKRTRYLNVNNRPKKQIDSVRRLNSIWNSRYQTELIYEYKNGKTVGEITLAFQQKYPKDRDCFCPVAMRSALYKICRQAVRKLQNIIQQFGNNDLPPLIAAGHQDVRGMVYNNNGIQVRLLLLDVYMLTCYDKNIVIDTINCMNNYVQQMKAMEAKRDERVRKEEFLALAKSSMQGREKEQSRQKPRRRRERSRKPIKEYKIDRSSKGYYVSY